MAIVEQPFIEDNVITARLRKRVTRQCNRLSHRWSKTSPGNSMYLLFVDTLVRCRRDASYGDYCNLTTAASELSRVLDGK